MLQIIYSKDHYLIYILAQSYDRHGNRLEPLKSALDLHREKFAQRLERSTADRTRRQEEAWARLDRCPSPIYEHPKMKRYVTSN